MNRIIAWFAGNHVSANLLMFFILVTGVAMAFTNKVEVIPDTQANKILIDAAYAGASPAEVEEAIVRKIENRLTGLAGIKKITSVAREGYGAVTVEVIHGWNLQGLLDEIKAGVDGISDWPVGAERPVVKEEVHRRRVIDVAVFGDAPEATIRNVVDKIKDDITHLPGISLANTFAVREREIHIEVSERTLREYGLTLEEVASAVRAASLDLPAGSVKTSAGEIMIRTKGRRYHAEDYEDVLIISRPDGASVLLGQIATIEEGFEDGSVFLRFMGKKGAGVTVYRVADQNALVVAKQVKAYVERIRPTLPEGIGVDCFFDRSRDLRGRIDLLLKNLGLGLLLVAIMLGLVLEKRLAFWVTLGIPISFCFCTALMSFAGVSVNMVSLAAFITVLGIVVDDAIIIGENIFRKLENGLPPFSAAVEGATEVSTPVIFSVLTTIVAFFPLMFGASDMGQILRNIPIVVILVLMGSLVESLFILPCHLVGRRRFSSASVQRVRMRRTSRLLSVFISGPFTRSLHFCIRWRYAVMAAGFGVLLIIAGLFTGGIMKFTLFPEVEQNLMQCNLAMPPGTPVERTIAVIDDLEAAAKDALEEVGKERPAGSPPLVRLWASLIGAGEGGGGEHLGQVWIVLADAEHRNRSMEEMTRAWRERMGPVADAESIRFMGWTSSTGNAVEVHLSMNDTQGLLAAAEALKSELVQYPGVVDVTDSYEQGKTEMQFSLKPAGRTLGITLEGLAKQVRHAFHGAEALKLLREKDEVKVLVRYPESERKTIGAVEAMRIRTPQGVEVPFHQVAQVKMVQGYAAIQRSQGRSVIQVMAHVDESIANAKAVRTEVMSQFMPQLKSRYPDLVYTQEGEGREEKESMTDVYLGFGVALFCIYALLAIPFKSFSQPLIVMAAIPFGLAGAVIGHLIMGFNVSLVSLVGMVGLTGVVVNDSLVLIHAANGLMAQGASRPKAILQAGRMRIRAILLTSITTFAGLTPMLLEGSRQAKFLIPMAISLGFGILFATVVTLLVVPSAYMIHGDFQRGMRTLVFRKDVPSFNERGF